MQHSTVLDVEVDTCQVWREKNQLKMLYAFNTLVRKPIGAILCISIPFYSGYRYSLGVS